MSHATELADRPAHRTEEIEITPEMTRAGLKEYYSGNTDFDSAESIVGWIFTAMAKAAAEKKATRSSASRLPHVGA
jgi:hypothetical protein